MKKKILSIILVLTVVFTMIPLTADFSFASAVPDKAPFIMLKATTSGSRAVKLSWNTVNGATKYVVYGQKCEKDIKKLTTVNGSSFIVKKIAGKKLQAHRTYKFYVEAYNGSSKIVNSRIIHFITAKTSGVYANASAISPNMETMEMNVGEDVKLGATVKIYKGKKHLTTKHGQKLVYTSDTPEVAKVIGDGTVIAKTPGTATIYIQDLGGLYCTMEITVRALEPVPTEYTKGTEASVSEEYLVEFNMGGHGDSIKTQKVKEGSKVTKPEDPKAEGYTFDGWYTNNSFSTEFNFDSAVSGDATIYAKWTEIPVPKVYLVEFNMSGHGDSIKTQKVEEGSKVTKPEDPMAEGYTFGGWYTNNTLSRKFNFDSEVTGDATIYAKWTEVPIPEEYLVEFNMSGHGDSIKSQKVKEGKKVTKPEDPKAEGYTFGGWYTDNSFITEFDFDSAISADATIYAKWSSLPEYTITVTVNETDMGSARTIVTSAGAGDIITLIPTPKEGYVFKEWTSEDVVVSADGTFTMPAKSVTVQAVFMVKSYKDEISALLKIMAANTESNYKMLNENLDRDEDGSNVKMMVIAGEDSYSKMKATINSDYAKKILTSPYALSCNINYSELCQKIADEYQLYSDFEDGKKSNLMDLVDSSRDMEGYIGGVVSKLK